ncbi:pentraxin fusion protein-like [Ascaphus truei]|uniref:pentraxin fusion protein-like n=1 Tax=Ascaphus truei TaxID=8439 RepID=UPI003F5A086B
MGSNQRNGENVARDAHVCQSSVYAGGNPKRAVDDNRAAAYGDGSCTHTGYDSPAWWLVDLKESYKISTVNVVNRQDCCNERLEGALIRIGNSKNYRKNSVCDAIHDVSSPSVTVGCNRMEGRYVSIDIPGRSEHLTLCEVEVYGIPVQDRSDCNCPCSSVALQTAVGFSPT